jgi:mannan endo-1,4-beta-mannosidase
MRLRTLTKIPHLSALLASLMCSQTVSLAQGVLKIGAWVGGPGTYPQPTDANVTAFEKLQGRPLDLLSIFVLWDTNNWTWTRGYADIAAKRGATLVVTWMPNGYSAEKIISGAGDNYLHKFAQDIKTYGKEVWLRPLHEANGDWYDWGIAKVGAGNTNENLIAAYRHIVEIFRSEEVSNVKWVWTTNATNSGNASFTGHYPGDAWVDMISIDGYNWGSAQSWSQWQSFEQVFGPAYAALVSIQKPLFIPEFSSTEHGGNKAAWIQDMFAVLPIKFPRIFALMWFSQSKSAEADWALNTSDTAVTAWKLGIPAATAVRTPSKKVNRIHSRSIEYRANGSTLKLRHNKPGLFPKH